MQPIPSRRRVRVQCAVRTTELEPALDGTLLEVPLSPYSTGSSDLSTAGPGTPLVDHPLTTDKTVVFVRHGMTTWNEQRRIQVLILKELRVALQTAYTINLPKIGSYLGALQRDVYLDQHAKRSW
jgi:hypothetical protein